MKAEPTPWRELVSVAAQAGLAPREFWRLSLKEWRAIIAPPSSHVLGRAELHALMGAFPDRQA